VINGDVDNSETLSRNSLLSSQALPELSVSRESLGRWLTMNDVWTSAVLCAVSNQLNNKLFYFRIIFHGRCRFSPNCGSKTSFWRCKNVAEILGVSPPARQFPTDTLRLYSGIQNAWENEYSHCGRVSANVTTEYEYEVICDLSNGVISSDIEWPLIQVSRSHCFAIVSKRCILETLTGNHKHNVLCQFWWP